jgi:hypothetical protein
MGDGSVMQPGSEIELEEDLARHHAGSLTVLTEPRAGGAAPAAHEGARE